MSRKRNCCELCFETARPQREVLRTLRPGSIDGGSAMPDKIPLPSSPATAQPAGPCAIVIFGASGDLTKRKLLPALVNLEHDGLLPKSFAVIGNARRPMSDQDFRRKIKGDLQELMPRSLDANLWSWLDPRLYYQPGDLQDPATYKAIKERLAHCDREHGTSGNYLFFPSTAPNLFAAAASRLGEAGLTKEDNG